MYIKKVVIDGFKSYAQRTEISGFDPLFNAITGLNGSGKSNILDSICFVLGISNLSQVRLTVNLFCRPFTHNHPYPKPLPNCLKSGRSYYTPVISVSVMLSSPSTEKKVAS